MTGNADQSHPRRGRDVYMEGTLRAVPTRTAEGPATELVWELSFDGGVEVAGPAGVARLIPPRLRMTVDFDYSHPRRLLGLKVSAGVIADRRAGPDSAHRRDIGHAEAALLDRLLGGDAAAQLAREDIDEVATVVTSQTCWDKAGMLAMLCTRLADTHRPLDGLWAAEAAHLVHLIDPDGALSTWATDLAAAAAPALRALPAILVDRLPGAVLARLHSAILACAHAGADNLGALASTLDAADRQALDRQVEDALSAVIDSQPVHAGATAGPTATLTWRSGPADHAGTTGPRRPAPLDHSARGLAQAHWEITHNQLTVRADLDRERHLPHFAERTEVRATTIDGRLVAAAMSMRQDRTTIHAALPLPPGVTADNLFVCVGRDLPVEAVNQETFDHRQSTAAARQQTNITHLAEEIAETLPPHDIPKAIPASANLAGARSLAWGAMPSVQAAELEHQRLEQGGETELGLEETDQLTWAASQAGNDSVAAGLDRAATQAHDILLNDV